ncbi:glycosyl hydrolase 115 family protein [Segatella albensis]|uniref:glycosyl hydrolase 115 family protein n=1 Tax=Segatella albensis TaxID=77768 RepID=UPI00048696EE|nr:glycosyl hydrolase 115 family protein [Segatella albensis]
MTKKMISLLLVIACANIAYATEFINFKRSSIYDVELTGTSDTITYDPLDWKGVRMAVENLRHDLKAVTGSANAPVVVGTIGKSKLAKKYKQQSKELQGKWEQYLIFTDKGKLVILGSDKRGTIYGIYELSRQIGVSPWYWMADAPIQKHDQLFAKSGIYTDGEPKVKYRGIFINDEWPSFGTWCKNQFGGINSKAYARIFELMLRLKANYFWPAMWDSRFNEDDPLSPQLADDMGIVMGTSHHEPMMRAHKEYVYRKDSIGAWDYATNKANLDRFFEEGLERNKAYDNLITIGMRGDGDVAMGNGDDEDNMKTLKDVVDGQREIIERVYKKPASEVPQLWAIFTEVQRYYDAGFTVPDDVTLLFCDNNWGYIRRTGPEKEQTRKGGMGMYYHIDMNGGPWNDRWINTTTAAKIREQLNLAYQTGIDRIWIINVGDLKPKEMPIDFIMHYAWNPDDYPADKIDQYMVDWARSIFGGEYAREIADIVTEYSNMNLERKPEVQRVGIYSVETGEEQRMFNRWDELEKRTLSLSKKMPAEMQDAFYQLVEYPAVASAGVAKIYLAATLGDSITMQTLFERDKQMTDKYNKVIAGGKWDGMMLDKHIGYRMWSMPNENTLPQVAKPSDKTGITVSETAIMAHDYTRRTATDDARWVFLPGLGRGKGNMGIEPVTAKSRPLGDGATLEYDIHFSQSGKQKLALGILPTNDINPARGLRIGVRVDDGEMQTIDARQGYVDTFNEYTKENIARSKVLKPLPQPASDIYLSGTRQRMRSEIFDNLRWLSIDFDIPTAGNHTIKVVMIDPEIVVEKLVINPDNEHPSYHGKE